MHILTVACAPVAFQFVFKTAEAAQKAWDTQSKDGLVTFTDDFGQTGEFAIEDISCRMIEDCNLSRQAHIERSLHQTKMQNDAQKAAENDPALRASLMRGPPVLNPMGMPFNGRGN